VPPFYRHMGEGRWSWAQHNGGKRSSDKVAARVRRRRRVVAWPFGIDGCVACASWQGWDTGHGKSTAAGPVDGRSGLLGHRDAPPRGGSSLPAGADQGRGEKKDRDSI
jgi:hypothetical protein